jgi:predicted aldo/keto reductase-like oxidoreductase
LINNVQYIAKNLFNNRTRGVFMESRGLGKTGLPVGVFSFGGIVVRDMAQKAAARIVQDAVERGVSYFDVAPSYGNAQVVLGQALRPHRSGVFLAGKSGKRTKDGLLRELRDGLRALQTDYFDVFQIQAVREDEVEAILRPGGAVETLAAARKSGLVRFIGFSSHNEGAAVALMRRFSFDTVLFPVNWACWLKKGMGKAVLAEAARQNMGCIGVKALAEGTRDTEYNGYPKCWYQPIHDDPLLADLALRFTLSLGVHTAISPADERMFQLGLTILERYAGAPPPLNPEELRLLEARAQAVPLPVF